MSLPAAITNLGAPASATREVMAALRAEKARQIEAMMSREHQNDLRVADHVEANPQSIEDAKRYVSRFLASERHQRYHWVLRQWKELLETKTPAELASILRDTSEATEELRSSPPFCGINFER
jgi:hypothetical protein